MAGKAKRGARRQPNWLIRNDLMRLLSDAVGHLSYDITRTAGDIAMARLPKEKCPKIIIEDLRAAAPEAFAQAVVRLEQALREKEQQVDVHKITS